MGGSIRLLRILQQCAIPRDAMGEKDLHLRASMHNVQGPVHVEQIIRLCTC